MGKLTHLPCALVARSHRQEIILNDATGENRLGKMRKAPLPVRGRSKGLKEAIYVQRKAQATGTSLPFLPSVLPCAHKKVVNTSKFSSD